MSRCCFFELPTFVVCWSPLILSAFFLLTARQVEKIQHFTHLLADPNREAERGEVYLSQCFRHVSGTCFTFLHFSAVFLFGFSKNKAGEECLREQNSKLTETVGAFIETRFTEMTASLAKPTDPPIHTKEGNLPKTFVSFSKNTLPPTHPPGKTKHVWNLKPIQPPPKSPGESVKKSPTPKGSFSQTAIKDQVSGGSMCFPVTTEQWPSKPWFFVVGDDKLFNKLYMDYGKPLRFLYEPISIIGMSCQGFVLNVAHG